MIFILSVIQLILLFILMLLVKKDEYVTKRDYYVVCVSLAILIIANMKN